MRRTLLASLVACVCLGWTAQARADVVSDWNAVTLTHVSALRAGPPGLLDIALVHTAMHDAVQAIEGRFHPYYYADPAKLGIGSPVAAAAAAPEAKAAQTEFTVSLDEAGAQKIQVIKVIREITGLGLKEAKDLVDGAPKPVKENIAKEQAEDYKKKLEAAGAKVSLK